MFGDKSILDEMAYSPSTIVTIGKAESAPPLPLGKEDILKAMGIRVKKMTE